MFVCDAEKRFSRQALGVRKSVDVRAREVGLIIRVSTRARR